LYENIKNKIISFAVIVAFLILVWNMLDLALLTFIFTFIFFSLMKVYQQRLAPKIKFKLPYALVLSLMYIIGIGLLVLVGIKFIPVLVDQVTNLTKYLMNFDFNEFKLALSPHIPDAIEGFVWDFDISGYVKDAASQLTTMIGKVAGFSLNLFFAIVLSFMMLLEKRALQGFGKALDNSSLSDIYRYFMRFGINFCNTFGMVMKVQVLIAFINCVLSSIALSIMGFSNIFGLAIMIFCLGLIPVAGVFISLVPLCLIAFGLGGITKVVAVIVMVAVIHALEAYILNPKLMSSRTSLPVCFVFIILLVAEAYLHVWGLLIGVPIFVFVLTMAGVQYEGEPHGRKKKR
jgi:predicted PurR-regulated permease PerM